MIYILNDFLYSFESFIPLKEFLYENIFLIFPFPTTLTHNFFLNETHKNIEQTVDD